MKVLNNSFYGLLNMNLFWQNSYYSPFPEKSLANICTESVWSVMAYWDNYCPRRIRSVFESSWNYETEPVIVLISEFAVGSCDFSNFVKWWQVNQHFFQKMKVWNVNNLRKKSNNSKNYEMEFYENCNLPFRVFVLRASLTALPMAQRSTLLIFLSCIWSKNDNRCANENVCETLHQVTSRHPALLK